MRGDCFAGSRLLGVRHSCLGCILTNMYRKLFLELAFKNELGCPSVIVQTNPLFSSTLNITAWRKSGLVLLRCFALMSDTGRLSLKIVQRRQTTANSTGMSRRSVVTLPLRGRQLTVTVGSLGDRRDSCVGKGRGIWRASFTSVPFSPRKFRMPLAHLHCLCEINLV